MKKKFLGIASSLTLFALVFSPFGFADDGLTSLVKGLQDQMQSMQKTIDSQNRKIQALESRPASAPASGAVAEATPPMSDYEFAQRLESATGGANKWLKDLKFSGDMRLRYEAFKYTSGNPSETDDRNRFRYRLRFGFEKKFHEDLKVGFALASGENPSGTGALNVDPTSTNTTFDNNFNFKSIYVEKAFAQYNPGFLKDRGMLKGVEIGAGKVNNPFEKGSSDMIWDRDVKPEGIYEKFDFKMLDTENFDLNGFTTLGQFVLDEDASTRGDANLYAFQFGVNPTFYLPGLERPVDVVQAFSMYNYDNYARNSNFLVGGTTLARGNTNVDGVTTELDAGEFKVIESYTELGITPMGVATKLFLDYAMNTADETTAGSITNENHAFAFGAKIGSIIQKGDWELGWAYKRIGGNAVVGAFNDSDFGDGHSGRHGNVFKAGYALMDNVTLNVAAFFVRNLNSGTAGVIDQEQNRFQTDLVWKF